MKVRFLKEHLKNNKGDVRDIEDGIASYLIILGVVEPAAEKIRMTTTTEKKVIIKAKEKKSNAGPGK